MANGLIGKVTAGGGTHLIASTAYFTCATAAATAAKVAAAADTSLDNITLMTGLTIYVKFTNANGVANPTLALYKSDGTTNLVAAKPIMRYGTTTAYQNAAGSWRAGAVVAFTYDGTNWVEHSSIDDNSTYYYESCYVSTAAGTAAKAGTCSNYALQKGYLQVLVMNANTSQSALTLNINSTGAKPIYINGAASSASNYTLPKAMYLVYYDGTNFYFRTDGALTATGSGAAYSTAANGALTYGTLPIAQGGTGKTTAADAWTALGGGASGKHADSYFALAGHTHTTSLASDTGTSTVTLTSGGKFKLTAGGTSVIFTMPTSTNNAGTITGVTGSDGLTGSGTSGSVTIKHAAPSTSPAKTTSAVYPITIDQYGHITAAGSAQTILALGTTASTAAKGNHTHTTSLASDTGTSTITLASAGKYKLTAGGTSVIFTMPTSNNYSHPTGDGNLHVPATGTDNNGKVLKAGSTAGSISWGTLTASDVGITVTSSSVSNGTTTFNKYTHPTTAGNKHIPSGGSSNQFLKYSSSGTATWATVASVSNEVLTIVS